MGEATRAGRAAGRPRPFTVLVLSFVILAGTALRVAGIGFGLPNTGCRPDENHLVNAAGRIADGHANPQYFRKPTLFVYQLGAIYTAVPSLLGVRPGETTTQAIERSPGSFYLASRLLACLYGVLTIPLVFFLGRRFGGDHVGLIAALFFALCFLHVRDSHFGTVDVPFVFFATAALIPIARLADSGLRKDALLAAVLTGLAASTKYTGFALLIPLVLAQLPFWREGIRWGGWLNAAETSALAMLVSFIVFLAGSPFILLDFRGFAPTIRVFIRSVRSGHYGMSVGELGLFHYPVHALPLILGWAIYLLGVVGALILIRRRRPGPVVLLLSALAFFLVVGTSRVLFARYVLPIAPVLVVSAAIAVETVVFRLTRGAVARTVVTWAVALLAVAPVGWRTLQLDGLLMTQDTRLAAAEWMDENIPAGSRVLMFRRIGWRIKRYGNPQPAAGSYRVIEALVEEAQGEGTPRPLLPDDETGPDIVFARDLPELLRNARADYIVIHRSPLMFYSIAHPICEMIESSCKLVHRESYMPAGGEEPAWRDYDQQDAFYIPMRHLARIERPGPEILIYTHKPAGE